jgi:hypothetical protein
MSRSPRGWVQGFGAAGVLAALLVLFLWTPLTRYREVHFTSADLLQGFSLTEVEAGHVSTNQLTSDTVTEMIPWVLFNRGELAAGRLPLWNPWNASGCPHLANYQSAVFSPFSLPYYFLDLKPALLVSAGLRLLALGLFTYLFLRELGTAWIAALLGSVAFMLSAYSILLLGHPHGGVMVALPAGLWFAEKALRRCERAAAGARPRIAGLLAGLAITLGLGLLVGHPEPMPFIVMTIAAWISARLLALARAARARGDPVAPLARAGAGFVLAGLLAAGLAAFQILPFLEYLDHSTVLSRHGGPATFLDPHFWPLAFFPALLGIPNPPFHIALDIPPPNYIGVATPYLGATILFLAILGIPFARRDRRLAFFLAAAAAWVFFAYDLLGSSRLLHAIPGAHFAPMNRSEGTWAFLVSCASALALDGLLRRGAAPAWKGALATALSGLGFYAVFRAGARSLMAEYASLPARDRPAFDAFVASHLGTAGALFAAGVVSLALLWVVRSPGLRLLGGAALVLIAFLGDGWIFRNFHAVSEDRFVYPVTPAIRDLKARIGSERVVVLGEDTIPPHANLPFGIAQINNNDAVGVRDYDAFFRSRFGASYGWHPILQATTADLRLCGVRWVLAKWDWLSVDSRNGWEGEIRIRTLARANVLPGRELEQTFVCDRDRLQAVMVYVGVQPGSKPGDLRVQLRDRASGALVGDRRILGRELEEACSEGSGRSFAFDPRFDACGRPIVLVFDPQPDSRGRTYAVTLAREDDSGGAVYAWALADRRGAETAGRAGEDPLAGALLFAWVRQQGPFERVQRIGDFGLYRDLGGPGKYWTVGRAVHALDGPDALELLRAESFDPRDVAVIGPADGEAGRWRGVSRRLLRPEGSTAIYLVQPDGRTALPVGDEVRQLFEHLERWSVEPIAARDFAAFEVVAPGEELERRLGAGPAGVTSLGEPPRVVRETPTSIQLEVERAAPGFLVVSQSYFPGWRARVDGAEVPLLRANYAFTAVELQAGRSLVDLEYDPGSLRWGFRIALASAACGLLLLVLARRPDAAR